ncbi:MAG: ABC transporter permease [Firmicutes bacterium]|nr:ABC transporter permease [Bacillota bacterium]
MKKKIIYASFIFLVIALVYAPILMLVAFSFSETRIMQTDNFQFGFGTWRDLFQNQRIMSALFNTILIATLSAALAVIIATFACMGIIKMKRRAQSATMILNQIPFINATIVTAFSLVLLFAALGIFNAGYFKLILAHTLICLPISVLVILPRLRSMDQNMFEAAQDLGAPPMHAMFSVVIPQLMPAMIAAFLLGFSLSLDDFIITQFNNDGVHTISTVVYSYTRIPPPRELRALGALIFGLVLVILIFVNIYLGKRRKKSEVNR